MIFFLLHEKEEFFFAFFFRIMNMDLYKPLHLAAKFGS